MKNTLKYKGFIGSVSFEDEDNILFGKIEGIITTTEIEVGNFSAEFILIFDYHRYQSFGRGFECIRGENL